MRTSKEGVKFIQGWETLQLKRYWDNKDGWTIGWGHLITEHDKLPETITIEKANELLSKDLRYTENLINLLVKVKLTQQQFDALVSLVYNIGVGNFMNSTILQMLNHKSFTDAANQFQWWRKDDGKVVKGLVKRRAAEKEIFMNGVYNSTH